MDGLLTAVKTTKIQVVDSPEKLLPEPQPQRVEYTTVDSPDKALRTLREQPDSQTLKDALQYLCGTAKEINGFNIKVPGPLSAQIVSVLVNTIVPDFWESLGQPSGRTESQMNDEKLQLVDCLKSASGLGAILTRIRTLLLEFQQQKQQVSKSSNAPRHIENLLYVLTHLLSSSRHFLWDRWDEIQRLISPPTQRQLLWREIVSLTASGKIISITAQAEDSLKTGSSRILSKWFANGASYGKWLGRGVAHIACSQLENAEAASGAAFLLGKSLSLGYTDNIVEEILLHILTMESNPARHTIQLLQELLRKLRAHEQRQFLISAMHFVSKNYLDTTMPLAEDLQKTPKSISGSAALIKAFISSSDALADSVVTWLTTGISGNSGTSLALRRAALSALQHDEDRVIKVMERSMEQFGDELFIKHTPVLQQEALAQVLLLSCGYVHRSQPMFLFTVARSSAHMKGTSNRIGASSLRARFLGMTTAMAISELIDKSETRLKFEISEHEFSEVEWYQQLVHVSDRIGSIDDIKKPSEQVLGCQTESSSGTLPLPASRGEKASLAPARIDQRKAAQMQKASASGPRIIELLDESDEDDDLVSYAKPDSDLEDESQDPTLVQQNKFTAPVYIRDLLAGLRDTESYDRHQLALSNAAGLIRRKTNFGKEVTDNIDELATVLLGLNDQFELENFQEMRQQALIAVLLAWPQHMGPWFVEAFYGGDYSISQRVAILITLGLGAREMAGFREDTDVVSEASASQFPSNKLPEQLHKLYATEESPIDHVTNRLKHTMITPLALDAADKVTGPNALKVRTFSSRMEVEKKRKKPIANELAKIVAQSFFFPMTGGWWAHAKALGSSNIYYSSMLLPIFLKTLAILLHASGPSTLSLPQMTIELWDLLLSMRTPALNDPMILEALLFSFLTLLDVNEDKQRLVQEHAKELLETHEWVKLVFERTGGGDEDGDRVRSLAAGVLVRCSEVVEKYQRLLMGDMMDF